MRSEKKTKDLYFLRPVTLIVAALLCIISYFYFDIPITEHFKDISSSLKLLAKKISFLIDADVQYILWPSLYFLFRFLWKKELVANRCLLLIMSVPITNLIVGFMKFVFGRARPKLLFSSQEFGLTFFSRADIYQSMPSGHACTIGAICGAFGCFYPKAIFPLFLLAMLLAFSRVILTEHYLSDIIAAVAIGFFISQWIYSAMRKKNIEFRRR